MRDTPDYVYVNQDGSVRELSLDEREFLSRYFHPADGARPYIKTFFTTKDGWGSVSGFLLRKRLPKGAVVEQVNPNYKQADLDARCEYIEDSRRVGDIITQNADGSVLCTPNPDITHRKRFALFRELHLQRQREREALAKCPRNSNRA
jgi:hypothetical protein